MAQPWAHHGGGGGVSGAAAASLTWLAAVQGEGVHAGQQPTKPTPLLACFSITGSSDLTRLPTPPLRRPRRYLPHIGRVTIIMNDYPMFKYALIAVLGLFVLTSKE